MDAPAVKTQLMKRAVVVYLGVALAILAATPGAYARSAGTTRGAYVTALIPVVRDEFAADGISVDDGDIRCVAEAYVNGFTLPRLRAVGSPATVAKVRAKQPFDFERFGVTKAQEARIVTAAQGGCLGVARVLAIGFQAGGHALSDSSQQCLTAQFAADAPAETAYLDASIRQVIGKAPQPSAGLLRAGAIIRGCLTPEEQQAIQPAK